eukprot:TRINITY_DN2022_c0_g1_i3.p1 TRINITY_DN2022_c0_g1~~TRINITY_DN2022_c0_g1_i3.p1  ORF type:complete len:617 (-),score=108.75 TRINITY_DN2022_c0_g1_i3:73-1923(-)
MKLVSGAMDNEVRFHQLEGGVSGVNTREYLCHSGRVKAMDIENSNSHLFWSASEDGTVRQFDERVPHLCSHHHNHSDDDSTCDNVLIDLSSVGPSRRTVEITGIAVNPVYPDYIAIATRDPYVRLYDRRMLTTKSIGNQNSYNNPVSVFAPLQVLRQERSTKSAKRNYNSVFTTHVAFSPNGRELLANYSTEHVYLFDIFSSSQASSSILAQFTFPPPQEAPLVYVDDMGVFNHYSRPKRRKIVSNQHEEQYIEEQKIQGNKAFHSGKDYSLAIHHYSLAIQGFDCLLSRLKQNNSLGTSNLEEKLTKFSRLFSNRSFAYLKRNWKGDTELALFDSERAIHLDSTFCKAKLRRIEALKNANLLATASQYAKQVMEEHKTEEGVEDAIKNLGVLSVTSPQKDDLELPLSSSSTSTSSTVFPSLYQLRAYHQTSAKGEDSDDSDEENETGKEDTALKNDEGPIGPSLTQEKYFYVHRFVGHSNMATDIKEASFLGDKGEMIGAGSDDGRLFIWEKKTEKLVDVIHADADVVNCIQCNPYQCTVATSGIESVIRLWSPLGSRSNEKSTELEKIRTANQKRMSESSRGVRLRDLPPEIINRLLEQMNREDSNQRIDCRMS